MTESDAERKKRLAEALRTNLRRRKAQARETQEDRAEENGCIPPAPTRS